jgi:hypothetical protein
MRIADFGKKPLSIYLFHFLPHPLHGGRLLNITSRVDAWQCTDKLFSFFEKRSFPRSENDHYSHKDLF